MNQSWSPRNVVKFVRETLGCGCPEHVFEKIELSRAEKGVLPLNFTRINVGDTLLVYIVRPGSGGELQDAIKGIISAGKGDRDVHGFNRFRLVIAGDENKLDPQIATNNFLREVGEDQKMHIHFVRTEAVQDL